MDSKVLTHAYKYSGKPTIGQNFGERLRCEPCFVGIKILSAVFYFTLQPVYHVMCRNWACRTLIKHIVQFKLLITQGFDDLCNIRDANLGKSGFIEDVKKPADNGQSVVAIVMLKVM